ncbi:MAG: hypothetical protein JWM25_421, partial [Thermoleophilia bacterium]|nr:hypothetical protein [Thermoleophilia bacterium]
VEEEHRLSTVGAEPLARLVNHAAHVGEAGADRAQLLERHVGLAGNEPRDRGLARSGRAHEHHVRHVALLELAAQPSRVADEPRLALDLVEGARAHSVGERRELLAPDIRCGFEEVGHGCIMPCTSRAAATNPRHTVDMSTSDTRPQLAGMALQNGVLMIGPTSWAAAVRTGDGSIRTTTQQRPANGERVASEVPLLRGPVRLVNMLRVLPRLRRALPEARLGVESREMVAGVVLSTLATNVVRRRYGAGALAELVGSVASLAITVTAMRGGQVARYHGSEHKAIGGYEQERPAVDVSRVHPRCGTQLAIPMLVLTAAATQGALRVAPGSPQAARAIGQLIGVATATELFRAAQRGHGGVVARTFARAGMLLQRHATTAEPTPAQLEVADAALEALLVAERA